MHHTHLGGLLACSATHGRLRRELQLQQRGVGGRGRRGGLGQRRAHAIVRVRAAGAEEVAGDGLDALHGAAFYEPLSAAGWGSKRGERVSHSHAHAWALGKK
jgi:hypothetical protein